MPLHRNNDPMIDTAGSAFNEIFKEQGAFFTGKQLGD